MSLVVTVAGCAGPTRRATAPVVAPATAPDEPPAPSGPEVTTLGESIEGRPVEAWRFDGQGRVVLVLGGFHGDEPSGVGVVRKLVEWLDADPAARGTATVVAVPVVNPDGYLRHSRCNARGVDINRNFPTGNWVLSDPRDHHYGGAVPASEPETRIVMELVERIHPDLVVSVHSIHNGKHCNNYDGPARELAEQMAGRNGYPVAGSIGYLTPGSFGTWAGRELGIPTITLELPSGLPDEQCWAHNRDALQAVLRY